MSRARAENSIRKILDNILFLEEVFGDQADRDIPKLPVLEMARCFDLQPPRVLALIAAGARPGRYGNRRFLKYRVSEVAGWMIITPSGNAQNNEPLRVRYLFRRWLSRKGVR